VLPWIRANDALHTSRASSHRKRQGIAIPVERVASTAIRYVLYVDGERCAGSLSPSRRFAHGEQKTQIATHPNFMYGESPVVLIGSKAVGAVEGLSKLATHALRATELSSSASPAVSPPVIRRGCSASG
jgi:hypothetical protein